MSSRIGPITLQGTFDLQPPVKPVKPSKPACPIEPSKILTVAKSFALDDLLQVRGPGSCFLDFGQLLSHIPSGIPSTKLKLYILSEFSDYPDTESEYYDSEHIECWVDGIGLEWEVEEENGNYVVEMKKYLEKKRRTKRNFRDIKRSWQNTKQKWLSIARSLPSTKRNKTHSIVSNQISSKRSKS